MFLKIFFFMVKYLNFYDSSFYLNTLFNVNGKAHCDTRLVLVRELTVQSVIAIYRQGSSTILVHFSSNI